MIIMKITDMAEQKATNITWDKGDVAPHERHKYLGQKGCTVWMTGLSASGKSTVAAAVEQALLQDGLHSYRLDGDNIRHGLNRNLGFSAADRAENIRRIGEVAKLFADSGMITITSFISPYASDRKQARKLHEEANLPFFEVYISVPLSEAERRDPKGMYKKARAGEIKGFTGVDDPYEEPVDPELVLRTDQLSVAECVDKLLDLLEDAGIFNV